MTATTDTPKTGPKTAPKPRPKLRAADLRDIGWAHWDPLLIAGIDGSPPPADAVDEYDSYLMCAAGMLINAKGIVAAGDFLSEVEEKDLALGAAGRGAIDDTVQAIRRRLIEMGFDEV